MKYRDIDKFIARFALERGYSIETARKRLLWRHLENERILTELLMILKKRLEKGSWIGLLDMVKTGKSKKAKQ